MHTSTEVYAQGIAYAMFIAGFALPSSFVVHLKGAFGMLSPNCRAHSVHCIRCATLTP